MKKIHNDHAPYSIGIHCLTHQMNLNLVQTLSTLPLVKHIESLLQTLHAYFAHYLKHYLEFTKLFKIMKTKGHKIFHIVKIKWVFQC